MGCSLQECIETLTALTAVSSSESAAVGKKQTSHCQQQHTHVFSFTSRSLCSLLKQAAQTSTLVMVYQVAFLLNVHLLFWRRIQRIIKSICVKTERVTIVHSTTTLFSTILVSLGGST